MQKTFLPFVHVDEEDGTMEFHYSVAFATCDLMETHALNETFCVGE